MAPLLPVSLGGSTEPDPNPSAMELLQRNPDNDSTNSEIEQPNTSSDHSRPGTAHTVWQWLKKNKLLSFLFLISLVTCFTAGYFIGQGSSHCGTPSGNVSDSCTGRPPPGWVSYMGRNYYYSEEKLDWLSSKKFCEGHGAMLAVLKNDSIKENVIRFKKNGDDHWFGYYKTGGRWKWVDEPVLGDESLNNISCKTLNPSEQWDADCLGKKPFICISM